MAYIRPKKLSGRTIEVVASLICNYGDTDKTKEELFIEPSTIKTHLGHVQNLTGLSSRLEIAAYFLKAGYITLEQFTKNCNKL